MNKRNFETEEEARLVADVWNKSHTSSTFCPQIEGRCRQDCMCFVEAKVHEFDLDDDFTVVGPNCTLYPRK